MWTLTIEYHACSEALFILELLSSSQNLTFLLLLLALGLGQQLLGARVAVSPHQPPAQLAEAGRVLLVGAVHVAAVQEVRDLVHLLAVAEGAAELGGGHGPHEVHTPLAVLTEEGVVGGDLDGEALGVLHQPVDRPGPVLLAALDAI